MDALSTAGPSLRHPGTELADTQLLDGRDVGSHHVRKARDLTSRAIETVRIGRQPTLGAACLPFGGKIEINE
jgi:hypothetical protein